MVGRHALFLTHDDKDELIKFLENSSDPNSTLYRRAKIVLLKAEGKSLEEIAKETGLTKQTVAYIVKLFKKEGLNGIIPKKRGKKEKFSNEDKQKIINLVNQFAPFEFGIKKRYWTLRTIVKAMRKIYNIKISAGTVRKILKDTNIDLKTMRDKFKKRRLIDYLRS
ncbi:MAG: transposase [Candidatus Kryptonium sp.]